MTPPPYIRIMIPGVPVPASRARVKGGQGGYYLGRYSDWLEMAQGYAVAACLREMQKKARWRGPIGVRADFWGARANADLDNLVKAALDAVSGIVMEDDRQVVWLTAHRFPSPPGEPHVQIEVYDLSPYGPTSKPVLLD